MSSVANKSDVLIPAPLGIPQIFVIEDWLCCVYPRIRKYQQKSTYINVPLQPDAQYQWSSKKNKSLRVRAWIIFDIFVSSMIQIPRAVLIYNYSQNPVFLCLLRVFSFKTYLKQSEASLFSFNSRNLNVAMLRLCGGSFTMTRHLVVRISTIVTSEIFHQPRHSRLPLIFLMLHHQADILLILAAVRDSAASGVFQSRWICCQKKHPKFSWHPYISHTSDGFTPRRRFLL